MEELLKRYKEKIFGEDPNKLSELGVIIEL